MRFFLLFLLFSFSCQSQSLLLKPVRINLTAGSVNSLLQDLNSQPGVTLSYSSEFIDLSKNVKLTGKEKTVEDYLTSILRDQKIVFIEEDGKIFLIPQPSQKKFTLNGYIRDKNTGERLIGASVYLPDKHSGTTSNTYGFF